MEIVAACISSFATEVAKVIPIKRHVSYILDRKNNLEDFKEKAKQLEDERESVKHAVEAAERNGEKIELGVRKWMISVDQKIKEYNEKVGALEDKAKERCFNGLCPNVKFYYRLGKRVQEDAKVVAELLEQGRFDRVSYRPALEGIGTMSNNDYEAFQSRASILVEIMENLRDPNLKMIGVYGMPGVGKTMLVKEVARKVREEYLFDEVVMATITHNPNIKNIQGEIADMLGLRFDEESVSGRAMRLRQRLRSDKKVLVILDDIWAKLDLDAIGISFEDDKNIAPDENEGSIMQNIGRSSFKKVSTVKSKILLTSRNLDVLFRMNAEKKFECRILSREEAMTLFVKIVGDVVNNPSYKPIANQVVEKCGGLPVAVSTIANTLIGMSLDIWENALRQLERSNAMSIEGMEEGVYSIIELSYTLLKSEEAQSLFQLCALGPQGSDISIDLLLAYILGLDLLEGVNTLEEARKSVSSLVHKLKACSLLLSGYNDKLVKMHDIVRDVSISILSKDSQMFVIEDGIRLKDLLKKGILNNCSAISLRCFDIHHRLPKVLECPKLKLFLLIGDDDPQLEVPDTFFAKMNDLQVLDLTGMHFPSLPSSFLSLTNLQTLCLACCKLSDIAIIANFKKLDILSFSSSEIKELPNEIGQLTQLRLLDLSDCSKLEVIPANIISSLSCLEELYMDNSFNRWDVEGNASLVELKYLRRLTTLHVHIRDAQIMSKDLFSEMRLERYKIFIGGALWDWFDEHKYSRTLKLMPNSRINWDRGIRMLLRRTEDLYVDEVQGAKSSLHELDDTGFPDLKNLRVKNNSEIQYIINSTHGISCEAFPLLESLFLHNLSNLKNISHGQIYAECFRSLKIIKVENCDSLKNLFSFSLAKKPFRLQEIEVTDCKNIVDIVGADTERDNEATDQNELRELRSITLQRLPQLINFCFQEKKDSISQHGQIDSTIASPLFTEKIAFPQLENLKLSSMNIERIWHYQIPRRSYSMQNLTSLIIEGCDNLKDVLSYSMAESLPQLKSFEVIDCRCMQQIVVMEEIKEGGKRATLSFPRLISLKLKDLHKLIRFCHENYFLEFPSLKILEINCCLELKGFINISIGSTTEVLFNEQVAFPNLERVTISHLRNVKRLWFNQLHADSFCKMKELKVEYCDELLNIFPSFVLGVFQRLEILIVTDCESLEEVFELQAQELEIKDTCDVAFQLKQMCLFRLPNLKHVWNKDPHGNISFQNLQGVIVLECWSLKRLFPFSIAKGLPQLEILLIASSGVEEIVSKSEGLEQDIRFEFNLLSFVNLWLLPNLKCFYPGMHTTVWPVLKNLRTYSCGKIKILDQLESHNQQPLFHTEKVIPQLEELSLSSDEIAMLCGDQFSENLFCHIKVLQVTCSLSESVVSPFSFLQRFYNLEMLELFGFNFKELSPHEGNVGEEKEVWMLPKFKKLKLNCLRKLTHLWKQESPLGHICASLETLKVWNCDCLINLGSSSASFENLTTLDVWKCKGIEKLITSPEAQSLVRLVKMRIRECEMMKEVVASEGDDEATHEIIFRELKSLELHCLASLRSFCSGNYTFKFPSLEQVIVSQCPRLNSFCHGALSTPKLQRVRLEPTHYKGRWVGDLNATVELLYEEKVGYRSLNHLKLSEFPELLEIWNRNPQEILDLKNLEFLEFWNSDNLGCIFKLSMALSLVRLRQLEIKKCSKTEAVIKEDGSVLDQGARKDKIAIFPCLKSIFIECCPDLTSFYSGNPNLMECPSLEKIEIAHCPNMTTFVSIFPRDEEKNARIGDGTERNEDDLEILPAFFCDKIRFPKLEKLKLSSISIERIWRYQLPRGSYWMQNLTSLIIEGCDNLKHVFSYSMAECLQQLQSLEVIDCRCIQQIVATEEIKEDEKRATISFPLLISLKLKGLPKLIGFCHENYFLEFPSLKILQIEHCVELKGFINKSMSKDITIGSTTEALFNEQVAFPNLEKVTISHLGNVKRLWYNQLHADSFCKMTELKAEHCDELLNIFPSFVLGVFNKLEILRVTDCGSLEEVFELQGRGLDIKDTCVVAFQLKELMLLRLPRLKHVWNKDPQGNISFQTLSVVNVMKCWSLKSLFPFSIAKGLPQLERLIVQECGVEEIVSKNEGLEQETRFEFNHLSFIKLWTLRSVKCFYSEMHTTAWPVLKNLRAYSCEKIKILGQLEFHIQQPLFQIEKVIPQLEELSLSSDEIAMLCGDQFSENLFGHIKVLQVTCSLSESVVSPFSFLQRFYSLEMLELFGFNFKELSPYEGNVGEEKEVWMLPKFKKLKLNCLRKLTHLWKQESPLGHICASLETLEVWNCDCLINLGSSSASFENLTTLDVWKCKGIEKLITSPEAQSLARLVKMRIRECEMMKEVVASEGDDEATHEISFRELKRLELHCLASLRSFCSGNYTFKFPSLEQVIVSQCPRLNSFCHGALSTPKLQRVRLEPTHYKGRWVGDLNATVELLYEEKVGYRSLKHLKLSEFPELLEIWNRNPQEILDLKNLEFLEFCNSDNLGCIFNLSMALSLVRLQELEIKKCNNMEAVIKEDASVLDQEARKDKIAIFPSLKSIFIECCPDLTSFYLGNPTLMECPSLEKIEVAHCPNVTTFVSIFPRDEEKNARIGDGIERNEDDLEILPAFFCDKIRFPKLEKLKLSSISIERIWRYQLPRGSYSMQNLTSLIIEGCDNLKHIFSYYMAECLQQLQSLEVIDCRCIQQIVATEEIKEDEKRATISFPLLISLKLKGLPKLFGFCHENYFLEFPSLKILQIERCVELKGFINKSMSKDITIGSTTEALFNEQVAFPNLEKVTISHLGNVKRLWYNQLHADSFCKMTELKAEHCDELLNIFPSFVLGVFHKLETLRVTDCGSLEEVFELQAQGLEIKDTCVVAFQLKELMLFRLPKLKHVWNKDPQGNISFQTLRVVNVTKCWSLKSLFPFSIAKGVPQLERLLVQECGVEEIVSKNEGLEQETRFEFNHLSFIKLWTLRSLKCFYSEMHTTAWPVLKNLRAYSCEKIKILGQLEFHIQQPLFQIEKVIPQLEELSLSSDEIAMLCGDQFSENLFGHIKVLQVTCSLSESVVSPFSFLQRFYSLEMLELFGFNFKELSPYEGNVGEEKEVWMLPKFKKLKLNCLRKLTHLWKQESPLGHICASLETLEVWNCDCLINLGSSSASFENLTTLDVWKCKGIEKLITSPEAQSLARLVKMRIRECEMMKEVVASEGDDEATHEISFRELKRLELHCLASLRSFCSGNYTFKFPSLEQVIVSQCPRLNSFCHGALSTPKLQRVRLEPTHYKGRWVGDLNATVELLYEEKVGYRSLKHLKLSEFPELLEIWNRNPQEILDLKNLEFLEFCNSDNLGCIFNLSMALSLVRLQELEIKKCNNMEAVIKEDASVLDQEARKDKIAIFPSLKSIFIECCPDLTSFYLGNPTLMECPSLEKIEVAHCPNVTTFVSIFPRDEEKNARIGDGIERNEDDLEILPAFFCDKIRFPKLEKLKLSSISIERIWRYQLPRGSYSMQNLTSLIIEGCDNLKHIFSYYMAECLQQVQSLEVIDCRCIQQIVATEEIKEDEKRATISFPLLISLKLKGLPKLFGFCHENYFLEFPSLKILQIERCVELKGFINKSMSKDITIGSTTEALFNEQVAFPNLEKVTISHLGNVKRLWYNQLHADSFCKMTELKAEHCDELLNIFPSFVLGVFHKLETLRVTDCGSLEEVFELQAQGLEIKDTCVVAFQLKELMLFRLPKLKHVWNKDPQGNISFQTLRVVNVTKCWSLKSLFPFSIAKGVPQLERLLVQECGVEEIVSKNEGLEQETRFEFNHLSFIKLWTLRSLKCFYSEMHTTAWPVLKNLRAYSCEKIKILGQLEFHIQQPLFQIEKVIPQLEELSLSSDEIAMLCGDQFSENLFGHIKVLQVTCSLSESVVSPFSFLQRFYSLEMLELFGFNFKELSPYEGNVGEEKEVWMLPKFKKLKLNCLRKLTQLWKQQSPLGHICASLETLEVWNCDCLINLGSSSASFENLTTLDVWKCKGIEKLITSPEAQSLARLVKMRIRECEMMKEVVASEGDDEATHEISFRELKRLELHCLASLRSFCSGNYTFKFPSLEQVIVSQCPRLNSFCHGALSTPKLQRVRLEPTRYKGRWVGDLNATVELLYEEKVGYRSLKHLKLSEFPELLEIWNRNPQEILDLKNLEFLEFCNSDNLGCIFNLSMALSLVRLQELEIKKCNNMEAVIKEDASVLDQEARKDKIAIFPSLKSIFIECCPDLTSFYLGNPTLMECPSLEKIEVAHCPNVTTFVSIFPRDEEKNARIGDGIERNEDDLEILPAFFCDKIRFPKLEKLKLSSISIERIWRYQLPRGSYSMQNLTSLIIEGCDNLKHIFSYYMAECLQQVQSLEVIDCRCIQQIVATEEIKEDEKRATISFPLLISLKLKGLPKLFGFCHENYFLEFPSLKILQIERCVELKGFINKSMSKDITIGSTTEALFNEQVIPQLEELSLNSDEIAKICGDQFSENLFGHIKVLQVTCSLSESVVSPFSFLQRFYNLEMLELFGFNFKELSPYEGNVGEEKEVWMLPKFKKLKLNCLRKLTHLWKQESPLGHICASLETLEVWNCDCLINLGSSSASFENLTTLDVWKCKGIEKLITSPEAQSLVCLVKMRIRECEMMKEVVSSEGDDEATYEIIFGELKRLELHCLASLRSFCSGNHTFKFPSLEQVIVSQCPRLNSFCHGALSTPKLQRVQLEPTHYKGRWVGDLNATVELLYEEKVGYRTLKHLKLSEFSELLDIWNRNLQAILDLKNLEFLEFSDSDNLGCIFSLSMALSLVRLQQLEIKKCKKMEAVIKEDESVLDQEARTDTTIIFPCLKSIFIEHCPDLTSFYLGSATLMECPSLKIIEVAHCPNMTSFVSIFPRDEEKNARIGDGTERNEDDLEILLAFFCDKVVFPNLEKMTISHLRNVKRLWFNQLHADSFCKMKELKVEYCDELLNIFPSFVLGVFQGLEILRVTDCGSLEEVFELRAQELEIKDTCVVALQLKELYLYRLPKLKHVWNKEPQGNISFQTLRVVKVRECWSLKSLFPFSIAKGLPQLERLLVQECGVEEIVSKNEGLELEIRFEFNQLSFLKLWKLTNLKCFYPGMHTIVWPVLKNLKTHGCEEIKIFGQLESHIQQSLFVIEKIIPQLEEVSFSSDDIAMICDGQFASDFFCHIKLLQITCYLDESAVFPFFFLQRFYNLEMLQVFGCNFKELSPYQGNFSEDKEVRMLSKLRKLNLDSLQKIIHLWKQDSALGHMCASLETLEVWRCDSLINLGASSASFDNLTNLDVWKCKGIVELITSSKAQSLARLVTMKIRECEIMKEVVASEGDDESTYEIIFRELKHVELHCLPSLRSFCSGNYSFKFPSLEQVIVSECPSLKSFCWGVLSTPKLERVQLQTTDYKGRWAGDLGATLEQLYVEQNVQIFEEETEDSI